MKTLTQIAILSIALVGCSSPPTQDDTQTTETTAPTPKAAIGEFGLDLDGGDSATKPGDDFFRFANGSWFDNYTLKDDEVVYGPMVSLHYQSEEQVKTIIEDLQKQESEKGSVEQLVGDYFASFMDVDAVNAKGIEPLKADLERIDAIKDVKGLQTELAAAGIHNTNSPVLASILPDAKNPDSYVVSVSTTGLGLPDKQYYLGDADQFKSVRKAYQEHIALMLGFTGVDAKVAKEQSAAILALETEIAKAHWDKAKLRDRDATYNPYTLDKLKKDIPSWPWEAHLKTAAFDLSKVDKIVVRAPDTIPVVAALVKKTKLATWKAYLKFHLLTNFAPVLSDEIYTTHFAMFGTTLSGQPAPRDRWKRGVSLVGGQEALGQALGHIYVDRHFSPEAKAKVEMLVQNLKAALKMRIEGLEWMGDETKKQALEKLAGFRAKVGYPDKWRSFEGVDISPTDLVANKRAVDAYWYNDMVGRIGTTTDKDEWFMPPHQVNAYYNPFYNEIVFPAAILQPPFFDPNADDAVNYGAIGAVIGHEVGHGFDDQGSKSDANGILRNWWTDEDRQKFNERTTVLVKQYNGYEAVKGQFVNGQLTLGENIGDLGGLTMAYYAYKISLDGKEPPKLGGLTGYQRFFLSWAQAWRTKEREQMTLRRIKADPHSPAVFRVNGVVRNMDEWYQAFEIQEGSSLYLKPEERVKIW